MTHSFKHHENDAHTVRPAQREHFQRSAPRYSDPQNNDPRYSAPEYASDSAPQGFLERFQYMMARRRKQKARALFNKRYGEENVSAPGASGSSSGASSRTASGAATRSPFASAASASSARSAGTAHANFSHSSAADTQGRTPKAAIYEGSARRAHKNTASFEDARKRPAPSRYSKATLLDRVLQRLHLSGKKAVAIGVVVCVCAIIIFLYEPTRNYYQGVRMNQAKQIELQALQKSVQHLEANTNEIRGEEGARTLARKRGYAAKNETLGQVDGLSDDYSDEEVNRERALRRGMARRYAPPDTWYSPVLDVLFGVEKIPDSSLPDAQQGKGSPENSPQNGSATSANGSATNSSNASQNGSAANSSNVKNTSRGSEQSR